MSNNKIAAVWVEGNKVMRIDLKDNSPRAFVPKNAQNLPLVLSLVQALQQMCQMPNWTAQVEDSYNQNFNQLEQLIVS